MNFGERSTLYSRVPLLVVRYELVRYMYGATADLHECIHVARMSCTLF